jgi:hypothetical protein
MSSAFKYGLTGFLKLENKGVKNHGSVIIDNGWDTTCSILVLVIEKLCVLYYFSSATVCTIDD